MGNGMNKILPGLFIGNFRDAKDKKQLEENNITHIVSIHDNAKKILEDKQYLCIIASDTAEQDLTKFFTQISHFIHQARLDGGGVLVHCLAGVSRSVTVTAAYIMTITQLGWRDSLNSIRGARSVANPNFGFQKQLQNFEHEHVESERKKFWSKFSESPFNDEDDARQNLRCFQHFVMTGNYPSANEPLYPLPYQAYKDKEGKTETHDQVEKDKHTPNSTSPSSNFYFLGVGDGYIDIDDNGENVGNHHYLRHDNNHHRYNLNPEHEHHKHTHHHHHHTHHHRRHHHHSHHSPKAAAREEASPSPSKDLQTPCSDEQEPTNRQGDLDNLEAHLEIDGENVLEESTVQRVSQPTDANKNVPESSETETDDELPPLSTLSVDDNANASN